MDRNLSSRDQTSDRPDVNFSSATSPQFAHSQYPFPIDSELTMSSNYPAISPSYTQQLQDATNSAKPSASPSQSTFPMTTNGSGNGIAPDPAMAPPQTPNAQPFVATAPRPSVDSPADLTQTPQTGDKRKRSKVSRACDECRRKKVRCIAPADDDGTPRTCTNCEKAGLTCGFERQPMKRGPSKGYIKDLADRVHSVEQVQAAALRQSLDIGSGNAPFDQALFSPEDASGARSRYSFGISQTPFAQAEFQRDRIPSTGAWGSNLPDLRPRDSGSLAIAPDQQLPPINPIDSDPNKTTDFNTISKNFWSDTDPIPSAKRLKMDHATDNVEPFKLEEAHLATYYAHFHPLVGLLPNADAVIGVVGSAPPKATHAFAVVLELLSDDSPEATVNGAHNAQSTDDAEVNNSPGTALKSGVFSNLNDLADWLSADAAEHPSDRSDDENLVCVWTSLLLALSVSNDIGSKLFHPFETADLIRKSHELISYLLADTETPPQSFIKDGAEFLLVVTTAWNVNNLLSGLHSLGSGLVPYTKSERLIAPTKASFVSTEASYLAQLTNTLDLVVPATQLEQPAGLITIRQEVLNGMLGTALFAYPSLTEKTPSVRKLFHFISLVLTRSKYTAAPQHALLAAITLGDYLVVEAANPKESSYNPVDVHAYTLTVIALLEFIMNCGSPYYRVAAKTMIGTLRPLIEKKSAAYHEKNAAREAFYAPDVALAENYRTSHWSDCLLNAMDHAKQFEPDEGAWSLEDNIVPAFEAVLRHGYLNILPKFTST